MRAVSLSVPLVLAMACGNSAPANPDADVDEDAQVLDAAVPDAAAPDAFDPCPGKTTFEVGMVDWNTSDNLPGVAVQEGDSANTANSAPNGRVVLCLDGTNGPLEIHLSKTGYVDRVHTTSVEAIAAQYETGVALSFRMVQETALGDLYNTFKSSPSDTATTFIAMVTDSTSGLPLAGATVSITGDFEGAFTYDETDGLSSGSVTQGDEGKVIFMNAVLGAGTTTVSVTGPTSCEIPATSALTLGVSSVAIACQP